MSVAVARQQTPNSGRFDPQVLIFDCSGSVVALHPKPDTEPSPHEGPAEYLRWPLRPTGPVQWSHPDAPSLQFVLSSDDLRIFTFAGGVAIAGEGSTPVGLQGPAGVPAAMSTSIRKEREMTE